MPKREFISSSQLLLQYLLALDTTPGDERSFERSPQPALRAPQSSDPD